MQVEREGIEIAKTELTIQLERDVYNATMKQGTFGCFEVTIGWFGNERVDYMTYDTKGIWRCYEIKVSKADFYSKAKKTFVGHFNYFVMTNELYEQVKNDIPSHVGVYTHNRLIKRPKRQELSVDEQILKNSLIRSLSREQEKLFKSENHNFVERMNRMIRETEKQRDNFKNKFYELQNEVYEKYGVRWRKEKKE